MRSVSREKNEELGMKKSKDVTFRHWKDPEIIAGKQHENLKKGRVCCYLSMLFLGLVLD